MLWVIPLGPPSRGNHCKVWAVALIVQWPLECGNWRSFSLRAKAPRTDRGELSRSVQKVDGQCELFYIINNWGIWCFSTADLMFQSWVRQANANFVSRTEGQTDRQTDRLTKWHIELLDAAKNLLHTPAYFTFFHKVLGIWEQQQKNVSYVRTIKDLLS